MITYPASSNFSKKIFLAMFSALQYYFLHNEIDDFLFTLFKQKNLIKKGKCTNVIQIFIFLLEQRND